jgi:hypothetical protein
MPYLSNEITRDPRRKGRDHYTGIWLVSLTAARIALQALGAIPPMRRVIRIDGAK